MKRFLFLISLVLAFCFADANNVDQNTAKEIGKNFMRVSANMNIPDTEDLQLVTTYNTNDDEVAFYIFNSSNGFVIVSAVDYAIPILGYSDEGRFDTGNVPIQMEEYLQGFVEQIQYGKDINLTADEETALQWELVKTTGRINNEKSTNAVAPLLATIWDQSQYYNNMCPADANGPGGHVYAGCVATAMGQVMKYWDYPTTGNGSHSYTPSGYSQQTANFGATTYEWANMPNELSSSSTTTQINAVAKLLWHCGVAVDMMYSPDGSGAYDSDALNAFINYFRYSSDLFGAYKNNYTNTAWFAMMKTYLDQGKPIYYSGRTPDNSAGHAFVCDGYNSSNQLHFNWGWSGWYNNYFALGALTPGSHNYSYSNFACLNIHPQTNPSVTYQISASASPTTGGTVSGAGSYQQYQTCTLTATPADGFSFVGWKENNTIVSTETTYSFPARQNRTLVAMFSLPAIASVSANYYPDANNPESPYAEVSWVGSQISSVIYDFEDGTIQGWTNIDADGDGNVWALGSDTGHSGSAGYVTSESYINDVGPLTPDNYLVSPTKAEYTSISFFACAQDASWASEHFGVAVSTAGNTSAADFTTIQEWTMTAKGATNVPVVGRDGQTRTQGAWYEYTVDLSAYAGQEIWLAIRHFNCTDWFRLNVDDITLVSIGATPPGPNPPTPPTGNTYDFEDCTMQGWTNIDADGDGNNWLLASTLMGTGYGVNTSLDMVLSQSYINDVGALTPDNYLVSPSKAQYSQIHFYACAQDANYPSEHFGVAVSTTNNTSASAFTTIQEWTLTAKSSGVPAPGRGGQTRAQGTWREYTVDLSAYAGQQIWVAIRHFNCTDMFYLDVDDITLSSSSKGVSDAPQIQYYKVYRTNCGNNGPYNSSNTTTIATQQTGSSYIDNTWQSLGFGSYKFGVSYVTTEGNESNIIWSNCLDKGVGYTISATASPSQGGIVNGAGLYEQGTTCTLTATANTGYTFVNWTKNGTSVSTNSTYSFTVTENATYVANFNINTYEVTASANPAEGGSVSGAGTFNHGSTCTLTATANTGYTFVNWTKNGTAVSTNSTYSFAVTESGSYVANFSLNSYTITATVEPAEGGSVTGGGTFNHGASCTLTATTNVGYTFANWTKNGTVVSTDASYTFTVTETAEYVAHFNAITFDITASANPAEGGNVVGAGTYNYGATCTLSATANVGYTFDNWTQDGTIVSSEASFSITVNEDASYVANFSLNSYTITVEADPAEGGTADGGGTFNHGETCTLTATPNGDYNFVNWTKNGTVVSANASYTFTVTEEGNYVAHFSQDVYYTVVASAYPVEGGTVSGSGAFLEGETCTLTATANTGYSFVNWTKNGVVVSTNTTYSFTVNETAEFIANFSMGTYTVTAVTNPADGGTINGSGTFNYGETATLVVIPNENYTFINWTENGNVVSTDITYSFTVTEDHSIVANLQYFDGVDENGANTFVIYPNPVSDKLMIESQEAVRRCDIYTVSGSLVLSEDENSNSFAVEVGDLRAGTYIIRLTTGDKVQTKQFIKK